MRARNRWCLAAVLGMTAAAAGAWADTAPLLRHTFEDDTAGWMVFGQGGKVSVTREAARVKEGKGALQFDYAIGKGQIAALLLPTPDGALAKAKSFRFWIKADQTTPLVVMLQEQGGGRYVSLFTVPKDQWQRVELSPADFSLSDGPGDPKDPDNRLDLDQVSAVGIADMGAFFAQANDAALADLLNVKTGPHVLALDELVVSEEALPESGGPAAGEVSLDRFARPQVSWIGVGGVRLSGAAGGAAGGLQAEYHQAPGKIAGFAKRVPHGTLAGAERLLFEATSAKPARLVVQLEEAGGGKYNTTVEVPGGSALQKLSLKPAEFTEAEDSKDSNGHLDLDQVNQVLFLDASGLLDMADEDNTLRISSLRVSRAR